MLNCGGVACRARRIGCSVELVIQVRTHGMTANTLAGAPVVPRKAMLIQQLAQSPVLCRLEISGQFLLVLPK